MNFDIDVKGFESMTDDKTKKEIRFLVKKSMESLAMEWENEVKRIIQSEILDTGTFLNSIHTEVFEEGDDVIFMGMDGVKYGVYHEYGTVRHFVPFYKNGNINEPILADWARRVLGMTEEEMLKQGGMMIEIKESKPFMRAMLHAQSEASEIFKETFTEL